MKSLPQIRKCDLRRNLRIPISIPLKTPVALHTTQKNSALRKTSLQGISRLLSPDKAILLQWQSAKMSLFRVQLALSLLPSPWTPCNKHQFSPHLLTSSLSTSKPLSFSHRMSKSNPKERHGQTGEGSLPPPQAPRLTPRHQATSASLPTLCLTPKADGRHKFASSGSTLLDADMVTIVNSLMIAVSSLSLQWKHMGTHLSKRTVASTITRSSASWALLACLDMSTEAWLSSTDTSTPLNFGKLKWLWIELSKRRTTWMKS